MTWQSTQQAIQVCRRCEEQGVPYLRVPRREKRQPPWEPLQPVRLYFVSVAPPWGGAYFWDETRPDAVRDGLFRALREPLGIEVTNCRQFRDLHLFLTPAVKCPSSKDNKDYRPSSRAVHGCARFLHEELRVADPERILALGGVPFQSLCELFGITAPRNVAKSREHITWVQVGSKEVPMAGTYFTGNNRHRGFSAIVEDIGRLLTLSPRETSG